MNDTIDAGFKLSSRFESAYVVLSVINSFLALFISLLPNSWKSFEPCLYIIQLILFGIVILVWIVNKYHLRIESDYERRKNAIQDAFGLKLGNHENTKFYETTSESGTFRRYVENISESVYFTKRIVYIMLKNSFLITSILLIAILPTLYYSPLNTYTILLNLIVASPLLLQTVSLGQIHSKLGYIEKMLLNHLVELGVTQKRQLPILLSMCIEYEALKAYYAIDLDAHIYHAKRYELNAGWQKISSSISYDRKIDWHIHQGTNE